MGLSLTPYTLQIPAQQLMPACSRLQQAAEVRPLPASNSKKPLVAAPHRSWRRTAQLACFRHSCNLQLQKQITLSQVDNGACCCLVHILAAAAPPQTLHSFSTHCASSWTYDTSAKSRQKVQWGPTFKP